MEPRPRRCATPAAPTAALYHCHSVATFEGGNLCLVLTPNGDIKIFAEGVEAFNFLGGTVAAERRAAKVSSLACRGRRRTAGGADLPHGAESWRSSAAAGSS